MDNQRAVLYGTRLDDLFDRWEATYPPEERWGFHRDGAVDESTYYAQPKRVLFVQVEPNSRNGAYDRFHGHDLRLVYPQLGKKENTVNLVRFLRLLCDGYHDPARPGPELVRQQLKRLAVMNLKKLAGSGKTDVMNVSMLAWRDRGFLRQQVELLDPHLLVTCGPTVTRLFGRVLLDAALWEPPDSGSWAWSGRRIIASAHPSIRPYMVPKAISDLAARIGGSA